MDTKKTLNSVVGVAVSLAVLFGTVWVISRAWRSGQKSA